MEKTYHFLSGIPRSGSTVLATILSQNPQIYTTPTSPLLDLLLLTSDNWKNLSTFQKNHHPDQIKNILNGIFSSTYKHVEPPIILDKHRAWPKNIKLISSIIDIKPKIIVTTRDIVEVLSSFIIIISKNGNNTYIDQELTQANKPINNKTRCRLLWEKYVSNPWTSFKFGYENHRDCLHLVDYKDIVNNNEKVVEGIYEFLDITPFKHTYNSLNNPQPENDAAYGLIGLHDVRPALKRTSPSADEILGKELADYYRGLNLEFWKK